MNFVRTYLAMYENSDYPKDSTVEDPAAKVRFPESSPPGRNFRQPARRCTLSAGSDEAPVRAAGRGKDSRQSVGACASKSLAPPANEKGDYREAQTALCRSLVKSANLTA